MTAIPAAVPELRAHQIAANDAKIFGRLLWRWLVVYPVTRSIFFTVATAAGTLIAAGVLVLAAVIIALVAGVFLLAVLAVLVVTVVVAPAPILLSPTQWGQFIDGLSGKKKGAA